MERIHLTLNFGHWDALALWGQWPDLLILFVWEFVWWDVSVLWGQYLHHRHRDLQIIPLILDYAFYCFKECRYPLTTLIIAFKDNIVLKRFCLTLWISYYSGRKTTAIQLYLADLHWQCWTEHSILHWEAVRYYLYVESWFGDGTLCSDYVLYSEEGCTDTLCESLRSWEANGQR